SRATSARPRRKHGPWKVSATATCEKATPVRPPRICGKHSAFPSASAPPAPSASRKPSATQACRKGPNDLPPAAGPAGKRVSLNHSLGAALWSVVPRTCALMALGEPLQVQQLPPGHDQVANR